MAMVMGIKIRFSVLFCSDSSFEEVIRKLRRIFGGQRADCLLLTQWVNMVMAQPTQPFNLDVGPISCHAWNKDRTQLALSPNNKDVHIYLWKSGRWERIHVLSEHDLPVTGIDWGHITNRIVTCSQDKNAFVWTFDGKTWKPELVLVRLQRAATCVKWSPLENKFAVGSGSKLVSVCYYEKENDWQVAPGGNYPYKSCPVWQIDKALGLLAICETGQLFSPGLHFTWTRVFSAYVKEVEEKPSPTPWGTKMPLGQLMTEMTNGGGGWVHSVKFSPDGTRLAWVGHDSSVSVCDAGCPDELSTVKDWYLPFTSIEWVSANSLVAAGHDCCPLLFSYKGPGQLEFVSKLDVPSEQKSNKMTAMNKFRNLDKSAREEVDTSLKTLHQNTITQIAIHSGDKNGVQKFSTTGKDGLLILWDLKGLQASIPTVKIA